MVSEGGGNSFVGISTFCRVSVPHLPTTPVLLSYNYVFIIRGGVYFVASIKGLGLIFLFGATKLSYD